MDNEVWRTRMSEVSKDWRSRWNSVKQARDPAILIQIVGDVISAYQSGAISLGEASKCLAPILTHPASRSWPDAELVAIGLAADAVHGDRMTYEDDLENWRQIEESYRRILVRKSGDAGAPGRR